MFIIIILLSLLPSGNFWGKDLRQYLKWSFTVRYEQRLHYPEKLHLICLWPESYNASNVTILKNDPTPRRFAHALYTNEKYGKITLYYDEAWRKNNMFLNQRINNQTITIYVIKCLDHGEYSCVVDGKIMKARSDDALKVGRTNHNLPRISPVWMFVYPDYYDKKALLTQTIHFHCWTSAIDPGEWNIRWWKKTESQITNLGIEGDHIKVAKVYTSCSEWITSTLSLRVDKDDEQMQVQCRPEKIGHKSSVDLATPCDNNDKSRKHPCDSSKKIMFDPDIDWEFMKKEPVTIYESKPNGTATYDEMVLRCTADIAGFHPEKRQGKYEQVVQSGLVVFGYPGRSNTYYEANIGNYLRIMNSKTANIKSKLPPDRTWVFHPIETGIEVSNGVEVLIMDTMMVDNDRIWICNVTYGLNGIHFKSFISWQRIDNIISLPTKPIVYSEFKKSRTMFEVTADCESSVSNAGHLTWILRSPNFTVLAKWPFYYYGGPNEVHTAYGTATVDKSEHNPSGYYAKHYRKTFERMRRGALFMRLTIKLYVEANMENGSIGCTSQDFSLSEEIDYSLFDSNYLLSKASPDVSLPDEPDVPTVVPPDDYPFQGTSVTDLILYLLIFLVLTMFLVIFCFLCRKRAQQRLADSVTGGRGGEGDGGGHDDHKCKEQSVAGSLGVKSNAGSRKTNTANDSRVAYSKVNSSSGNSVDANEEPSNKILSQVEMSNKVKNQ